VRSLEGFQSAVEAALAASVASVIEVQTDPNIISPRATIDSLRAQSRG
jgi:acetolactate synthase-1/2/3 large subunit